MFSMYEISEFILRTTVPIKICPKRSSSLQQQHRNGLQILADEALDLLGDLADIGSLLDLVGGERT